MESTLTVHKKRHPRPIETLEHRMDRLFWPKVEIGDCWVWTASVTKNGYGQFNDGTGKMVNVHRWLYQILVGQLPIKLDLDHLCRNRRCCNPDHLEPVTRLVNLLRGPKTIIALQIRKAA